MFNATHAFRRLVKAFGAQILSSSLLLLGPAGIAAAAGTIVNSNGFESPYMAGALQGQFGWQNAGSGSTSATVQGSIFHSGSQAVLVTRAANSDQRWAVPDQLGFPTQRFVTVDWDMRVSQPSNLTAFGPFFGVDSYDDFGTFGQLGSFGVDATTGEILYQLQDTGELVAAPATVLFNEWYHYRLVLDFGTDSYRGYVNGMLVATTGFVDRGFGLDNFSDADISAFAASPDAVSQGLSASAVFDNFVIRDGLLGDYDIDGDVDTADYTKWRMTFGTAVSPAGNNADGNKNGVVDAGDYVIWRDNLNASLFSGAGSGAALSSLVVPEPSGLLLILMVAPALVGRTFRRRQG